jgi:prepilin peptidase CpaA
LDKCPNQHNKPQVTDYDWAAGLTTLAAAVSDAVSKRIGNELTYFGILVGLSLHALKGISAVLVSIEGLAGAFVLFLLIRRLLGLGAGDVKLMAAVGAMKGFAFVLVATVYIALAAYLVGLCLLARQRSFISYISYIKCVIPGRVKGAVWGLESTPGGAPNVQVPFAIAIFVGVSWCIYWETAHGSLAIDWLGG